MSVAPLFTAQSAARKVRLGEDGWNGFSAEELALDHSVDRYWRDSNWWRSYGEKNWEFDAEGMMQRCSASINDPPIKDAIHLSCRSAQARRTPRAALAR